MATNGGSTATPGQHARMQNVRGKLADLRSEKVKGTPATAAMLAQRKELLARRSTIAADIGRPVGQGPNKGGAPHSPPTEGPPPSDRFPVSTFGGGPPPPIKLSPEPHARHSGVTGEEPTDGNISMAKVTRVRPPAGDQTVY